AIDKEIEDAVRESRFTHELVNQSLAAARLARELERSRAEIEGRYLRATELAERFGTAHQVLISVYQRAWTAFFWHEDFQLFDQLYSKVEEMARSSDNACHLELLNNLWNLAHTLGKLKVGSVGSDQLPTRTITLADALTRLSKMEDRPTTALHARSMLLVQQITVTLPNTPKSVFVDLREVISSCGGLVGYPLKPLFQIVEHLEPLIDDAAEFELLFEEMVATASKQAGEVEGAMVIMRRGAQWLEKEKFYDAIALFGRALGGLAKHETRQYLISGLNLLAHAYEKVGLLWAARGALLNSIALILNEYHSYSDSSRLRSGPISRLKWLEVQLGRFSQCLEWIQIDVAVMESIGSSGSDERDRIEEFQTLDLALAILMLRASPEQLSRLTRLPDVLEQMGLYFTKGALLLLLGQEDEIHKQLATEGQTVDEVYRNLLRQPMADDVSSVLIIDHDDHLALNSRIWGCSIQVTSPVESPFQELAESVLAAMEATLATAGRERVIGAVPLINIRIVRSSCEWFEFDLKQPTSASVELRCGSFDCSRLRQEDQFLIRDKICEFTASILVRFFHIGDFESLTQKFFQHERSFERGTNLTTSFVTLANALGRHSRTRLSDWIQGDVTEYVNQRHQPWMPSLTPPLSRSPEPDANQAEAEPETKSWEGFGDINQRRIQTLSLIDSSLWDSAVWKGTAFMWDEGHQQPPLLGILFEHVEPAATIFANWRLELGTVDKEERLRVIIVKGISRTNPFAYRVCVTSNIRTTSDKSDGGYFMVMSRCNTMEPKSDHNLRSFLVQYQQFRCYWIIYATLAPDGGSIQPVLSSSILKKSIVIRNAWEIGIHDEDCMAIQPDDDPFIPPEVADPPIQGLLKWMKSHVV
ncbi:MAG: hypothetical protein ABL974_14065, partial [Prosthecobacter sp.]